MFKHKKHSQNTIGRLIFVFCNLMNNTPLTSISPVDGRYHSKTKALQAYYSEYGLIRYRVLVEVEYFIALTAIPLPSLQDFPQDKIEALRDLYRNFSEENALWIKETEKLQTMM